MNGGNDYEKVVFHKGWNGRWTWHGYEGKMTNLKVFSNEDEVELFLNGISLGKKPAGVKNICHGCYPERI